MNDENVFKTLNYGLYVVGTKKEKNVGCIINTAMQITSGSNPLILISINKNNYTTKQILETKKFSITVLSEETTVNLIKQFGYNTSSKIDKYENINYEEISGMPVIKENAVAYIICEVKEVIDASTHYIIISNTTEYKLLSEKEALTYKKYQEEIKPKVIEEMSKEKSNGTKKYRCKICGYIYNGELPEDFICPVCGGSKEDFILIE